MPMFPRERRCPGAKFLPRVAELIAEPADRRDGVVPIGHGPLLDDRVVLVEHRVVEGAEAREPLLGGLDGNRSAGKGPARDHVGHDHPVRRRGLRVVVGIGDFREGHHRVQPRQDLEIGLPAVLMDASPTRKAKSASMNPAAVSSTRIASPSSRNIPAQQVRPEACREGSSGWGDWDRGRRSCSRPPRPSAGSPRSRPASGTPRRAAFRARTR